MKRILDQLARSGLLWDERMVAAIFAGNAPPLEEIVLAVVIGAMDAEIMVRSDETSTWNERRIARQALAIAFLSAIACVREREIASEY
ncbi:hypothetical protein [Paludibaculum fermentans]|uniref:hypothetical protein n=1 Tax=Paludibaculum fermentans TaxID=1473598 RepID=UPI003EC05118